MKKLYILFVFVVGITTAQQSSGATITFSGAGATGIFSGPVDEGIFRYDTFSGGLVVQAGSRGNPVPHMEGNGFTGGGVLSIIRNDIAGGLFTFDAADVAVVSFDGNNVVTEGFLLGASQGSDTLITLNGDNNWVTRNSVNLSGVLIDELRITLDALGSPAGWEELDNVVVTEASVPDAGSTALLMAMGLAGLGIVRRRMR